MEIDSELLRSDTQYDRMNRLTERIIGCAIEVHRGIGPGLLESAYERCLCYELAQNGLRFRRQVSLPVVYKGVELDCGYVLDIIVEDTIILELKAVDRLISIHEAQLLSYLRMLNMRVGLLLNFHSAVLKDGIKRIVNKL
ncbi:MAG: GxxExxY protein [Chloracidobacterium sp.]|nr:GxxExxY protein [Chloracidobacterium sp.]